MAEALAAQKPRKLTLNLDQLMQAGQGKQYAGEPQTHQPRLAKTLGGAAFIMEHETGLAGARRFAAGALR